MATFLSYNTKFNIAYNAGNYLPEYLRDELIQEAVRFYTEKNNLMRHEDFVCISNQISEIYPNEPSLVYYNPITRKGRLQSVYKTTLARLRRNGLPIVTKRRKIINCSESAQTSGLYSKLIYKSGNSGCDAILLVSLQNCKNFFTTKKK